MAANEEYTLKYKDSIKGWTSFYSFVPEWMVNLNNNFFTFKDGQIYEHAYDENDRNLFYGEEVDSVIEFQSNAGPSEVKMYRAVKVEGSTGEWEVEIDSEQAHGHVKKDAFQKKEDMYYAYIRNDNDEVDTKSLTVQGIGIPTSVDTNANTVTVGGFDSSSIAVGDKLMKAEITDGVIGELQEVGVVEDIQGEVITITSPDSMPTTSDYVAAAKNRTAESEGIRGYHAKVKLTHTGTKPVELYAVNVEATKSNL